MNPLHEELRALAERINDPLITWRKEVSEELLALAARAEREHSPEREAFVEAAETVCVFYHPDDLAANAHNLGELTKTYRAMLAAEEKRK